MRNKPYAIAITGDGIEFKITIKSKDDLELVQQILDRVCSGLEDESKDSDEDAIDQPDNITIAEFF